MAVRMAMQSFQHRHLAMGVTPHELILKADDRLGAAGIALPGTATEELPVDPGKFVPLRRDDVQAAQFSDTFAQPDIGPTSGHGSWRL